MPSDTRKTLMSQRLTPSLLALLVACAGPHQAHKFESEMQLVRGAAFRMGTDLTELEAIRASTGVGSQEPFMAEVPSHSVSVSDFLIDAVDVTNQQFAEFVRAMPDWSKELADVSLHNGRYLEHWVDGYPPNDLLDHPVTFITWQSAVAYCEWKEKRLPTEAEFEWAAQDGTTRAEYPWGNAPPDDELTNWGGNGIETTVPVGSYPPNDRGLYDMSGNVWHFTADPWLGSYSETMAASMDAGQAAQDPTIRRVVRGGSWGANAANLRVRYRDSHRPFDAREMVGFRCARNAS